MLWASGLQLFIAGAFRMIPSVLIGIVPVLATTALFAWTFLVVMNEARTSLLIQNDNSAASAAVEDAQRTEMIVRSKNGDECTMTIKELNSFYAICPTEEDPFLAMQGFRAYQSTTQVWAHRLTPEDVAARFPKGRFISSAGSPVRVSSGQYIVIAFPQGNEMSIVDAAQFKDEYLANATETTNCRVVSQVTALQQWDDTLRREGSIHSKVTKVNAKRMPEEGTIETVVDGKMESRRSYERGDYLVCGSRGGRYPMADHQFSSRYNITCPEPASDPKLASAGFKMFKAKGKVGHRTSAVIVVRSVVIFSTRLLQRQVWSHKLTLDEVCDYFPSGQFFGKCTCLVCRPISIAI